MTRSLAGTTLAPVLALVLAAGPAFAHSRPEATTPANGETVASVEAIDLRFDKPMRVTAITVSRDGEEVAIERETGMQPATEFRALPASDLAPGAYEVEWRGLSSDGHPMNGAFSFTVAE